MSVRELVTRHFAVVGSTGVGKTTAVSMLLKTCLRERPNLRVMILDPHNEYAAHFTRDSIVLDADSLAVVEITLALNDAFSIKIPDVDPEQLTTVGQAFDLVADLVGV